ncbi:hypothetical protein PUN28_016814 [Cardiocondyla obscurior]|uniref:Uncharacterized protein n=1 Tax=Cardiocondyla obscurior TaxID=286306 RepID=A0AAW2ETT8_9HYME
MDVHIPKRPTPRCCTEHPRLVVRELLSVRILNANFIKNSISFDKNLCVL